MRRVRRLYLLWVFNSSLFFSCQENKNQQTTERSPQLSQTMQVSILNKILYQDIPSASGMELVADKIYVVGDDSPFLYVLDGNSLKLIQKIELFGSNDFGSGRIPKALKPDLECLTTLTIANETHLVAFGSGSAPTRAKCFTIKLSSTADTPAEVKEYSLEKLYTAMQQDTALLNGDLLNLEAAAVTPSDQLILLQRSANTGPNALIQINSQEFMQRLSGNLALLPSYIIFPFSLPELAGSKARFSGAYIFDDKLFFTASVENTTDAILDGEVIGSFVGWLNISDIKTGTNSQPLQTALITNQNGQPYKGKVESLVIQEQEDQHTYRGLAITDNDNGESELLQIRIKI